MKTTDLTQGSIFKSLWIMAVPLISASFIQMAYSMTDMLWLGHLGSDAVAAAGAAGFFTWLCNALSFMTKIERLSPGSSLCQSGHYLIDYNRIYLCLYHHPGSPFTDGLVPF